jgi:hypothetical protein
VAVLALNTHGQVSFLPACPFRSLMIIAVDVVALYGLCTYGSRANLAALPMGLIVDPGQACQSLKDLGSRLTAPAGLELPGRDPRPGPRPHPG